MSKETKNALTVVLSKVKGGCGGSTMACNLAVYYANKGHKVVIMDCDLNQSCTLLQKQRPDDLPHFDVVEVLDTKKMSRTANALKQQCDILIIDGSPSLSEQTSYMILLADIVLIPSPSDLFSISAQEMVVERYLEAKSLKGKDIPAYFFMSMYNPRIVLHREFKNVLKNYEKYGITTLNSYFEYRTAYRTSIVEGKGAYEFTDEKAKQEVENLGKEVLNIAKTKNLI